MSRGVWINCRLTASSIARGYKGGKSTKCIVDWQESERACTTSKHNTHFWDMNDQEKTSHFTQAGLVKFLEWLVARWATSIKSLVAPNAYR